MVGSRRRHVLDWCHGGCADDYAPSEEVGTEVETKHQVGAARFLTLTQVAITVTGLDAYRWLDLTRFGGQFTT